MGVIYNATTRSARLTAVLTALDAGAGPAVLVIGTAAMGAVLATVALTDPAGSVTGDVLTLTAAAAVTASATGTAGAAEIRDSNGVAVVSGLTVGLSGADVILDSLSITSGQAVSLVSAAITHNTSGV